MTDPLAAACSERDPFNPLEEQVMFGIDESKVITFTPDGEPAGSVAVWETKAQFSAAVT